MLDRVLLVILLFQSSSGKRHSRNLTHTVLVSHEKDRIGRKAFERQGSSRCNLRTDDMFPGQCCPGIDLQCYGCNPKLIKLGIDCEDQAVSKVGTNIVGRDCFCDASCTLFDDCCEDHAKTCPELAPTTTTVTIGPITGSHQTSEPTTKTPKTRPPRKKSESWIFKDLFKELKTLIKAKFGNTDKFDSMMSKFDHIRFFMLNAEHNCRKLKFPYIGKPNDGSMNDYNMLFSKIRDEKLKYESRMGFLSTTFRKYITKYYLTVKTEGEKQGCDGKLGTKLAEGAPSGITGKQFKIKRLYRKVSKAIDKILRRKVE